MQEHLYLELEFQMIHGIPRHSIPSKYLIQLINLTIKSMCFDNKFSGSKKNFSCTFLFMQQKIVFHHIWTTNHWFDIRFRRAVGEHF